MWDGSESGWCLVELGGTSPGSDVRYHIYNIDTKVGALIESESVRAAVVRQLLEAQVPVLSMAALRAKLR